MVNEEHTRWLAGHSLFRFLQQSTCSYVFVCLKGQKQTKEKLRHSTIQQSRRKLVFCIGCLQILLLHILLHAGNQQINFVHDYRHLQLWRSNCSSFFSSRKEKIAIIIIVQAGETSAIQINMTAEFIYLMSVKLLYQSSKL